MKVIILILVLFLFLQYFKTFNKNNYNNKKILVMFSGGLDSTIALYYLLKNTNAEIYVHHVIMDTSNGKHLEELNTCNKMVKEFRKIRNFEFTTSKYSYFTDNVDRKTSASRQDDLSIVLFQAIRFCTVRNYLNIDHISIADSKHDKHKICDEYIKKTINSAYFNHWDGNKPTPIDVLSHFYNNSPITKELENEVVKNLLPHIKLPYEVHSTISQNEIIYKLSKLTIMKNKMYYFLPRNIRALVLSCRNSKNGIKCGSCFKCKQEKLYI
jgi:7-cyano-7-deazaguanine synthase in queuosine biosynthesis